MVNNDIHLGDQPLIGTIWQHYKGKKYKVIAIGKHSETLEDMIVYQGQYSSKEFGPNPIWMRPLKMWEELVEYDGKKVPRFVISS